MTSSGYPHRRYNPLTGEWVLVSPQRTQRPWRGQVENLPSEERPPYDPSCYLCPGNERAGGARNPQYDSTFVFTNDFSALLPETPPSKGPVHPLLNSQNVSGTCRVICFSPRHDLTLPEMSVEDILKVVEVWCQQISDLGSTYRWVQVFENKGEIMGCSNPHPHGQVWASNRLPNEPAKEDRAQSKYYAENGHPLLMDYLDVELHLGERIVLNDDHWAVMVPYWAFWPFEVLLLPRRHVQRLPDLSAEEKDGLASILKTLLTKMDNLFEISFPYSMGWHGAPTEGGEHRHWQLHAHFYPPLLRSATVKKFRVGYEMLAEPQRDLTAEQSAQRLRQQSEIHYKIRSAK